MARGGGEFLAPFNLKPENNMNMTLIPAYGRDYKTAKAAKADYAAGKDFLIAQFGHPYDGKPANKEDMAGATVTLRFDSLRKITVTK